MPYPPYVGRMAEEERKHQRQEQKAALKSERTYERKYGKKAHNTPGDGTGFSSIPETEADGILEDVDPAGQVSGQGYPAIHDDFQGKVKGGKY